MSMRRIAVYLAVLALAVAGGYGTDASGDDPAQAVQKVREAGFVTASRPMESLSLNY
jgi:hypothetical protein